MTEFEFMKSTYSTAGGECVEVALNIPDAVAIRDSKHPTAGTIRLTPTAWRTFLGSPVRPR
ncbi:DUF397 domain-containing protein [Streptomyces triticagri]|uniref:DUF397 domain-containing protein n=1 Tax=Streptomyces triticagri TaxID=2293568 RepID=A0A372M995_9ACTN|nr:DUF397 domain-containing protein [Streptomyces triticagri]RFU87496.1 DUF397 domain-containing protein [Streptomyces triticagri]